MRQVDIKGFEDYQITDDGRVWSKKSNKWLKVCLSRGYLYVGLCKEGKRHTKDIHRLIAEAFIPNPDNKPCIDHINTIRTDNRIENLRWCTYTENNNNPLTKQKMSMGRTGKKHSVGTKKKMSEQRKGRVSPMKGKHHSQKVKEIISNKAKERANCKKVYQYTKNGELVKEWKSVGEAAMEGYSSSQIYSCCSGKRNSHNGFKWAYQ